MHFYLIPIWWPQWKEVCNCSAEVWSSWAPPCTSWFTRCSKTTHCARERKEEAKKNGKKTNPPDIKVTYEATSTCHGEWCSQHGVEFVTCLTVCVPVNSVSIPLVARECVFATQKFSNMIARDKRFLLYYYYATTIYQFHGKGNRVELPECLKRAVRELHPDD